MPGRFATISESEVITRCKLQLHLNDNSHNLFLSILINEGLRSLGALSIFKKQECTLEIEGGKAALPAGFQRYLALRSGCDSIIYADTDYLVGCGCSIPSNVYNQPDLFQISHGIMYFNSDFEDTTADMAYMGMNLGENGKIIIYEDFERALNNYACWQFTLSYDEDYKESKITRHERQWIAQRSKIRGEDVANDFQNNKRRIKEIWGALLVSDLLLVK